MAPLTRTLSTVRAATTLARARPAYAAGFRAAVSTVGPLVAAMLLGSQGGTWLSLGGFNAALSDRGGAYRDRALVMLAVMGGTASAVAIGSVAGGHIGLAVPVTFAIAVLASLARVWGAAGVSIGSASLSSFVIALAYPSASPSEALSRAALSMLGSAWAMLVALLLWPLMPYRPARLAVAGAYRALGSLAGDIGIALDRTSVSSRPSVAAGSAAVRGALEQSRQVLAQLRRGRPASSGGRSEQLTVLADVCDQLFGHMVAAAEAVEAIPSGRRDDEAQRIVREALAGLSRTAATLALAVETERNAPAVALGWSGRALRAHLASGSPSLAGDEEPALHYLHAASILDRAAQFADTAAAAASGLSHGPGGTSEFEVPREGLPDHEAPAPFATLRAILTPDSVILRYALRVAVVTSVAVLLASLLHLNRGYWMTITVIVIMQPTTGATTHRALQRVIGTVVGGLLTALLGAWFHDPRAVLVLSFVFAASCVALMPLNYAAFSVFLTPTFVLLAEASAGDWHLAKVRVLNTLLGGALALAGARLLWPSPEWRRLPGYMAAALRANAAYLRCVGTLFGDRSDAAGEEMRAARRGIGLAMVNAEESFQRLLGEHLGPAEEVAPALSFLTYMRRFTASTASLALARHTSPPEAAAALRPFTDGASAMLDHLADAVAANGAPPVLPMLSSLDAAGEPVPALLRARVDRLGRLLRMLDESVRRWVDAGPVTPG